MDQSIVKHCPCCGDPFSLRDLLENPDLDPIGMQAEELQPGSCWYYFGHRVSQCGTTFAVEAALFEPFLDAPVSDPVLTGGPGCPGYCLCTLAKDFIECHRPCARAPYRRLLISMLAAKSRAVVR